MSSSLPKTVTPIAAASIVATYSTEALQLQYPYKSAVQALSSSILDRATAMKTAILLASIFAASEAVVTGLVVTSLAGAAFGGYSLSTIIAGLAVAAGAGGAGVSLLRGRGGRGRRALFQQPRNEAAFQDLEWMDSGKDCAKLYLCQLAAMEDELDDLVTRLRAPGGQIRLESASAPFEAAIELGLRHKNDAKVCNLRYAKCQVEQIFGEK